VKVLAEIPARSSPDLRTGTLRRGDLDAYGGLLEKLGEARSVLITGDVRPARRSVAAGLATAAAAAGTRTMLLECDLAEPGLADALGLANAPGLHEYLRGTAESEAILKPVILAGPGSAGATEPLVCAVAGRPAEDGWALLASDRFRQAIAGLGAAYELVVIDGPSLPDEYALSAVLGLVDSTLVCIGPGESRRKVPIPATGLVVQN
jgi:Mrp family chromosome partitioning ATPase